MIANKKKKMKKNVEFLIYNNLSFKNYFCFPSSVKTCLFSIENINKYSLTKIPPKMANIFWKKK